MHSNPVGAVGTRSSLPASSQKDFLDTKLQIRSDILAKSRDFEEERVLLHIVCSLSHVPSRHFQLILSNQGQTSNFCSVVAAPPPPSKTPPKIGPTLAPKVFLLLQLILPAIIWQSQRGILTLKSKQSYCRRFASRKKQTLRYIF